MLTVFVRLFFLKCASISMNGYLIGNNNVNICLKNAQKFKDNIETVLKNMLIILKSSSQS